jgi:hypothetical protein
MQVRVEEDESKIGQCGCGRSPTGKCVGFHALSEDEWTAGKTQLVHALLSGQKLNIPQADE